MKINHQIFFRSNKCCNVFEIMHCLTDMKTTEIKIAWQQFKMSLDYLTVGEVRHDNLNVCLLLYLSYNYMLSWKWLKIFHILKKYSTVILSKHLKYYKRRCFNISSNHKANIIISLNYYYYCFMAHRQIVVI